MNIKTIKLKSKAITKKQLYRLLELAMMQTRQIWRQSLKLSALCFINHLYSVINAS